MEAERTKLTSTVVSLQEDLLEPGDGKICCGTCLHSGLLQLIEVGLWIFFKALVCTMKKKMKMCEF